MAQAGYTPISLYYSTTASATPLAGNLVAGELALNTLDEKLYFKNSSGTVKLLASVAGTTNVSSISFGTTGLTPSTATTGVVTVAGTLAVANGGTGITVFGTGVATALGQNVTGSGGIVLATSPTLVTPALGTPSSVTLTNATGLPLSTGVTGTLGLSSGGTGQTTATSAFNALNPMTTTGDIIYEASASTAARLAIGTTGQVLTVSGGIPAWSTPASGVTTISFGSTGLTPSTATSGAVTVAGTLAIANGGTGASTLAGANIPVTNVANTFTAQQTFNGSSSVISSVFANSAETTTVSATAATGTINYDVTTQSVLYYTTNASANWTVNFRASSGTSLNTALATGQSVTVVFLVTQGATAYYNNAVTVDGTSVTPKYQGGTAWTAGNASSIDAYSYTITKTASATYTIFASQTQFK